MTERHAREKPSKRALVSEESVKDRALKEAVLRHYWAQGCFVQPEVEIRFAGGTSGVPKMITDVDILALRFHPDLYFERLLGDCRTLKGQSPISRVLWLRGLMDFIGSRTGLIVLGANVRIEQDHKLAANRLGIRALSEQEFSAYDKAIVYPEGSKQASISLREVRTLKDIGQRFPRLQPLLTYLYRDAWLEPGFGELIRHCIGHLRTVARELDPGKVEHRALFCDASTIFSVGVAECAGQVFHQYLQPSQKEILSESLKLLIWGGYEQYRFYQTLRTRLGDVRGGEEVRAEARLELPEWNQFVQLVRNILERPGAAFDVPWLLRRLALDINRGLEPLKHVRRADLLSVKFAMLIVSYLGKAGGLPREFGEFFVDVLVNVQSRLAASSPGNRETISTNETTAPGGEESRVADTQPTREEGLQPSLPEMLFPESGAAGSMKTEAQEEGEEDR